MFYCFRMAVMWNQLAMWMESGVVHAKFFTCSTYLTVYISESIDRIVVSCIIVSIAVFKIKEKWLHM